VVIAMKTPLKKVPAPGAGPANPPSVSTPSWLLLAMREPEPGMKWPVISQVQVAAASGR
jgi:hypothetical protein